MTEGMNAGRRGAKVFICTGSIFTVKVNIYQKWKIKSSTSVTRSACRENANFVVDGYCAGTVGVGRGSRPAARLRKSARVDCSLEECELLRIGIQPHTNPQRHSFIDIIAVPDVKPRRAGGPGGGRGGPRGRGGRGAAGAGRT